MKTSVLYWCKIQIGALDVNEPVLVLAQAVERLVALGAHS